MIMKSGDVFNDEYKGKEWGADAKGQIIREVMVEIRSTDKLNKDAEIVTYVQDRIIPLLLKLYQHK